MKRHFKYAILSGSILLLLQFMLTKIMGINMPFSHQVIIYIFILVAINAVIFYLLRDKERINPTHNKSSRPKKATVNIKKKLENGRERILLTISEHPKSEIIEISEILSIKPDIAAFHIKELEISKFVKVAHMQGSVLDDIPYREEWSTDQIGRGYLIHHKLIK